MSRHLKPLTSKLPSLTQWRTSPSNLARVDLKNHKWTWSVHLCGKLIIVGAILTAIGFGGSARVFTIKTKAILGSTVDADLQLAFLGLINKIMDLFVTKALQVTAGVVLTLWMTRGSGIRLADFELGEELTKPWAAISRFQGRWSGFGWKGAGWLRLLVTLPISVCVLLQGLAINTIGVPKERWFPEERYAEKATHPTAHFHGLDWSNQWGAAFATIGGGPVSWRLADGYLASSTNLAFQNFAAQMQREPYGWHQFEIGVSATEHPALDTRNNGSSSRGIAIHTEQAMNLFEWLRENGTSNARRAIGMNGDMIFACPSTTVTCTTPAEREASRDPVSSEASVAVYIPSKSSGSNTTFLIDLISANLANASTATCGISFSHVLLPINVWRIADEETASASVNLYGRQYDTEPTILPYDPVDTLITQALAEKVRIITARLENLIEDMTSAQWLLEIAREVRTRRNTSYASDVEALAPVVALLTNQLLATASWNVTYANDQRVESTNIRWQLYGSGPRLPWAWTSAIVLVVLTLAISASAILSFWHMVVPGEWLKAGGMLVAANSSPPVAKLHQALSQERRELEAIQIAVRFNAQSGTAEVVNAEGHGLSDAMALDKTYKWVA